MNSSWPEWIACLAVAASAAIAGRGGRWRTLAGVLAVVAAWFLGSAKGLLLPAGLGGLALFFCWKMSPLLRWSARAIALCGALLSAGLCWLYPLPEIPPLSGPFAAGTQTFELPAVNKSPALVVQVWYPAQADSGAPRERWLPDPGLAPPFPLHRIGKALAHSRKGAPLSAASKRYAVLFYEHGWMGNRAENVAQVEDLASQGFVVIAVDHPGQAVRVRHADGSVIAGRLPASPDLSTTEAVAAFEKLAGQCLAERRQNLSRVKEALALGVPPEFAGRLILEKMGILGFSFGGTSALRMCALDASFFAGANEDGLLLDEEEPRGPFHFFDEEMPGWLLQKPGPGEGAEQRLIRQAEARIEKALEKKERHRVILDGTLHPAFTDRIFLCAIPRLAGAGTRPAKEVHDIVTSRLRDFFQRHIGPAHDPLVENEMVGGAGGPDKSPGEKERPLFSPVPLRNTDDGL